MTQVSDHDTQAFDTDVLIVGAGPTGLMLAGWLARLGVRFRLIDKKPGISQESRALAVQARTLECYDQLGLAGQALEQGLAARAANVWTHRRHAGRVAFADIGTGLSPFPYVFILGQDKNEQMLYGHLQSHGGEVEWQCELQNLTQDEAGVTASLRQADGRTQDVRARYICGCDGAGSGVRQSLGIGFEGGTYAERFFVADTRVTGSLRQSEINLCLDENRFQAFFPMPGEGCFRIVGIVPKRLEARAAAGELAFGELQADVESRFDVQVQACFWFSTYRVHHRIADSFQRGRAFLLGDAGHIHSPAGGQGMNTGLMDAANLGWKLARVIQGESDPRLLASYGAEREPFAHTLVQTTDRAFGLATSKLPAVGWLRTRLVPVALGIATQIQALRRLLFRILSQTRVHYRSSPLSRGRAGRVHAGDRLPWVPDAQGGSNFAALSSLAPQLHVYGEVPAVVEAFARRHPWLPLQRFAHTPAAARAGLSPGAVYLIRPDGYVAYASERFEAAAFKLYLRDAWGWQNLL